MPLHALRPDGTLRAEAAVRRDLAPRREIAESWRRSVESGLRPDRFEVPLRHDVDRDARLVRAASPVIDRLATDVAGAAIAVLLTDEDGTVLDRRAPDPSMRATLDRIRLAPGLVYGEGAVGTNAIGTALAARADVAVHGDEHFADQLVTMSCAAALLHDPTTGRVAGVLDLTCARDQGSPLMLPLVRRAAREVEARLLEDLRPGVERQVSGDDRRITDAERRVAVRAAAGMTNRQIAEVLFVSPYTVDSHLRSVFRKLGINSRVDLARRADELGPAR